MRRNKVIRVTILSDKLMKCVKDCYLHPQALLLNLHGELGLRKCNISNEFTWTKQTSFSLYAKQIICFIQLGFSWFE